MILYSHQIICSALKFHARLTEMHTIYRLALIDKNTLTKESQSLTRLPTERMLKNQQQVNWSQNALPWS